MLVSLAPGATVLDFSFAMPDLGQAYAMGYRGVIGYLPRNPDATEQGCLNHAVVDALGKLGFTWSGVWEDDTADALSRGLGRPSNHALGFGDGVTAADSAKGLGASPGSVVFFAVDWDATPTAVQGYATQFAAAVRERGFLCGAYGSARVVDYIVGQGFADVGWQAEAWSSGRVSPYASALQRANYKPIAGTDHNDVLKPLTMTASPDADLDTAAIRPHEGDDELTNEEKAALARIDAVVQQLAGPFPVSLFATPDSRWMTNTADQPPPAGGSPLVGLEHQLGSVGWLLETVTTVRAAFDKITALEAQVANLTAFAPATTSAPLDLDALAEAILARVKARI